MFKVWRLSGVLIVNFEHMSHFFLVFLLRTLNVSWVAMLLEKGAFYSTSFHSIPFYSPWTMRASVLWVSWKNNCNGLKASVRYFFIKFLFYFYLIELQNYEKCSLFHLKSSFRSRDIQIFVFLSFPLFLPVSHCFRGCLKTSLRVYDIINRLNKT